MLKRRRYRQLAMLTVLSVLGPLICPSAVRAAPPATLADAVEPALRRLEAGLVPAPLTVSPPAAEAGDSSGMDRWIAGPATVSATYLSSQEPWGTDELEFSISVPLASPAQRARLDGLTNLDPALDETAAAYRRWLVSGRLRDLFARHRRLELQRRLVAAEVDEVRRLQVRARPRFEAGNLDSFEIWQIEQSLRELSAELEKLEADRDAVARAFTALTGMAMLPAGSGDDGPPPERPRYEAHPYARLLAMQLERELVANRAGSPRVQPWNVALVSRELAIADQAEWQHGVALSVPFDIGGSAGPTVRSGERSLRRSFILTRDSWLADLQERWQGLMAEREALLAQQRLLTAPEDLASLERSLDAMDAAGELPVEQRLQRRRRLLQSQARPQQIEAALRANTAQLRQAAGLALGQD